MKAIKQKYLLVFYFCLLQSAFMYGQTTYPQNYFRYPLDSLPNLVSPFGSLRDNHFHSGMDLRTNGREGLPVYAAADGYISRIKVQKNGYGKAIYIEHANGYSTVYGHLQKYHGPIAEWIHKYQYINKTFEFDKIFMKPFLLVKKGDTIGFSGNSGGSTGPHVHFEIRNSKTEKTLNPALFGIIPFDTLYPIITKIHVYKFVQEGLLLKKQIDLSSKNVIDVGFGPQWKDTLVLSPETFAFGLEAFDYIHNGRDEKGIYSYSLNHNSVPVFSHTLNEFAFDETKYINAHLDYAWYKLQKQRVQKCFVSDGNLLGTYLTYGNKGKITPKNGEMGELMFWVQDNNKHTTSLRVIYKTVGSSQDADRLSYQQSIWGKRPILPGKPQTIVAPGLEIKMDPKSVYDTVYYELKVNPTPANAFSEEYSFHTPLVPIHTSFEIAIKPVACPDGLEKKLVLAYGHPKADNYNSIGGNYDKGWVRGKGSNFGNYTLLLDTIPPSIKWSKYKNEYDDADTLRWDFDIRDNLSGISKYEAFLNEQWVLLDYDAKNHIVTYQWDEVLKQTAQKLWSSSTVEGEIPTVTMKIIVSDAKGNKQEREFRLMLPQNF
jgi:hypothetical protein